MLQIVRRYLTNNPKMKASIDLMLLMREMKHLTKEGFEAEYAAWKERYSEFLNKRVTHKDGKSCFLHRKVRTVVHSIDFYLPYLFSFQRPECAGMPNTNNKIEETFTDLKKSLNNHTGMSLQNRKRFISGFFLQRLNLISLLFYFQRMVFLDYYAAPQAAYYAIPNREIFRGNFIPPFFFFSACKMTYTPILPGISQSKDWIVPLR